MQCVETIVKRLRSDNACNSKNVSPARKLPYIATCYRLAMRLIGVGVAALTANVALAQFPEPTITIMPAGPKASDVIQVTVNTNGICSPTAPGDGVSLGITNDVIQITLRATCPFVVGVPPPPYVFTVSVGPLAAGMYDLKYSISANNGVTFDPPQLLAVIPLVVGPIASVTAVPTLSVLSLAVLVGLLCLMCAWAIKRHGSNLT